MNIRRLRALAEEATPGLGLRTDANVAFIAACDPGTILALIRAVQAAQDVAEGLKRNVLPYDLQFALTAALAPFSETDTAAEEPPGGVGGET